MRNVSKKKTPARRVRQEKVRVGITQVGADGKKTLSPFGKTLIICLAIVLTLGICLALSVVALGNHYIGLMQHPDDTSWETISPEERSSLEAETDENAESYSEVTDVVTAGEDVQKDEKAVDGIINILLLGTDTAGLSTRSRTDSMIVVSINEKTKRIVLTSFMRDSFVDIPGYAPNRLNTAFLYGGAPLLFQTIDENFGIEVDRFVQVDYLAFIDIVNILGGVDIEVRADEAKEMNSVIEGMNQDVLGVGKNEDKLTDLSAGMKHLNGKQALIYARIRYNDSDFGRTERQRKLLLTIANKAKSMSIGTLNSLLTALLKKVSTNLTASECTSLIASATKYLGYEIETLNIPATGTYRGVYVAGKSVIQVDFAKNYLLWKEAVTKK